MRFYFIQINEQFCTKTKEVNFISTEEKKESNSKSWVKAWDFNLMQVQLTCL